MKVLVIGEFCVDKFVYGQIKRLCPEAPVPVFNPIRTVTNPGMAGNVVENIKSLMKDDVELVFWHQSENITKERLVDDKSNQMIVRIDDGELTAVSDIGYLSPERKAVIQESDLVIVSDYDKGFLSNAALMEIASYAKLSILDTKRRLSKTIADMFTFVKLNESESQNNPDIANLDNVIVTLGSRGARIGKKEFPQDSPKETIDVSGAGDTFVAAFGVIYALYQDLGRAIRYANTMSGIVVGKRGVATPY